MPVADVCSSARIPQNWVPILRPEYAQLTGSRMAQPISSQQRQLSGLSSSARGVGSAMVVIGAGLGAAILLGTLVLWFHYGTAVFFETIASGIATCF
jgi:hypothetical protein